MAQIETELLDERLLGCYNLRFSISQDKLSLLLSLTLDPQSEAPPPSAAMIQSVASEIATPARLSNETKDYLSRCLKAREDVENMLIYSGTAAIAGQNGRLVFLVKQFQPLQAGKEIERLDVRFIKRFDNIEIGTVVLRRYPPDQGLEGQDILGNKITATAGVVADLKYDSSFELRASQRADFEELVATKAGYLDSDKGAFTIKDTLLIEGDVDQRTGDIEFVGTVIINGDVMKDFSVIARRDITIKGDVYSGTVISHEGSITIVGNIGGNSNDQSASANASSGALRRREQRKRPHIRARLNLSAAAIDDADVEVGGTTVITNDIRNSNLRVHGILTITQGGLIGGTTFSVTGIEAPIIGSHHDTTTKIVITDDISASAKYSQIQQEIAKHKAAERMLKLYLGPYKHADIDLSKLDKHFRERIVDLRNKLSITHQSLLTLEDVAVNFLAQRTTCPTFQLNFTKTFHVGSQLFAQDNIFTTDKELVGPRSIIYNAMSKMFGILELQPINVTKQDV